VDPDSLNPDPAFQVNPDPVQGFDDQNDVQTTGKAFSPPKREHTALQN
jgi:hypothetical protein